MDVTNPTSPVLRGAVRLGARPSDLAVANGVVYAASPADLSVIDARQPTSPSVTSLGNWGTGIRLDVLDGHLYQNNSGSIAVYGLANPLKRTFMFSGYYSNDAAVYFGSRTLLAYDWDLQLLDMNALLPLGNIGRDLVPPIASVNLGRTSSGSRITIRAMASGSRTDVAYATDSANTFRVIRLGP
jgi:hypothetical protein